MCAVHQNAFGHCGIRIGTTGDVQVHGQHETATANFFHQREIGLQLHKFLAEVAADPLNMLEKMFLLENRKILESHTTRQRTSTKGGAVLSRANGMGDVVIYEDSAQRQASGDRLCQGEDVGGDAVALEGKHFTGASKPTLDFIQDERGTILIAKPTCFAQILSGAFEDAALTLNGFKKDAAGGIVDGGP